MKELNIITDLSCPFPSQNLLILNEIFHLLLLLLFQHEIHPTFLINI